MRNIDFIREVTSAAAGRWPYVLAGLSIDVPDSSRRHSPCPACGGTDRFRFDDNGRGSFICNQCGAGDGLDLIKKVNNCDTTEAAHLAADVLGIDYRAAQTDLAVASQRREQLEADRQQHEQERQKQAAEDAEQRRATFARLYAGMRLRSIQGESEYLQSKGLTGFKYPLMPDGSLLLELVDESGAVAAAQTITPHGEKRLLTGSAKRGAYHAVNAPESPQSVLIAEGLATALSVHLMRPEALTLAAMDAGNLIHVAGVMRRKYPQSQIIIAADNDHPTAASETGATNIGKEAAEKAALSVAGWVALPPTDHKADWDDFHQQNGLEAAAVAFNDSTYQPQGESVTVQLKAIEGGKKSRTKENGDISQMAASQKARLLSARWERLAVNTDSQAVYRYACGVWERLPEAELEREMVAIFDEHEAHYTEKGVKSVVATMKLQIPPTGEQPADCIGFSNGIYDLKAQEFRPHAPDNWLMNHNGIEYTPAERGETLATHAPNFTRWINHATGGNGDRAARIKAALFMVLARRHDWQLFIEVTGEGGSGKSVFSSIAVSLAGEHNTASASMGTLDTARGRAQLVGKSLIIMPDQTRYVGEGAGIKAITGGDPVEIDGKYEKQFTTVLNAVVLATNNEPMTFLPLPPGRHAAK
ncbi:toprim domain-containing protein [Enterobacter roggenkampii]|nr:toprim domain-containing protein [Enterobacter roggenkampii]